MNDAPLEVAAAALGDLVDRVVFVGGATIEAWVTDRAAPPVRLTEDVDAVCDVAGRGDYYELEDRLRDRGFANDQSVICRWRHLDTGLVLDVMPADEAILGFSNRWYELVLVEGVKHSLPSGTVIRVASPPAIIGTKLSAWLGRGRGDVISSFDVHDIVVLINGRLELEGELATHASDELRSFIATELQALVADPYFEYVVQDVVRDYGDAVGERAAIVTERLGSILRRLSPGTGAAVS